VSLHKAVLVGIQTQEQTDEEVESSLQELKRLVQTLGFEVVGILTQKRHAPSPATVIGVGKVKELARWTGGTGVVEGHETGNKDEEDDEDDTTEGHPARQKADKVIFDNELTPNQLRNLEKATGAEVLDRTGVIVEIFHRHAKTREAKLQVEIARLNYLAPRIRATGAGERQGGGIGAKGVGETAHELDRRRIRDRVAELTHELQSICADQANRRSRRREQMRVALVGYTNAGKSSLMRALTGSQVLVADKLFATLDTTVRAMQPEAFPRVLVSDTVGFIKKLPHDLVASFRSTLDEAGDASLLLYVVDASDPTFSSNIEVSRTVLAEIDAADIPSVLVLNKVDCLDIAQVHLLAREYPEALQISTRRPEDIERVNKHVRAFFEKDMQEEELLIAYEDQQGLIGEIRAHAAVVKEDYEEKGVRLKLRSYPEAFAKIHKLIRMKNK
jgi:GTP-binding protein HflX